MVCFMIIGLGYTDTRAQAAVEAGVTEEMALVNNVYVQEPMVEAPGTQRIMIGIGDADTVIESAALSYQNIETGQVFETEATQILEGFAVFEIEYKNQDGQGEYRLEGISYMADGKEAVATFAEMGIDASYGVDPAPLITNVPVSVIRGRSPMKISCSLISSISLL